MDTSRDYDLHFFFDFKLPLADTPKKILLPGNNLCILFFQLISHPHSTQWFYSR